MKSTIEILTKLQENSQKNHDEIFTRLYRYLLRPDMDLGHYLKAEISCRLRAAFFIRG